MWDFIKNYGFLILIIVITVAAWAESLAERDDKLRIQNELNNKAEEIYQKTQPTKQKDEDRLLHMY